VVAGGGLQRVAAGTGRGGNRTVPAPIGKQIAIQETRGAFARFWKGISGPILR